MAFKPNEEKLNIIPAFSEQEPAVSLGQKKIEKEKIPEKETQPMEKTAEQPADNAKIKKRPGLLQRKQIVIPQVRDELTIKIEKILEAGLDDSYQRLSPIAKQEFKIKGEQAALKIRDLLKSTHLKFKKILKIILDWIRLLPGVNRFFLEQEAKIKADRIIALKKP